MFNKSDLVNIIENTKPFYSFEGIIDVIRVPGTDVAVKYTKKDKEVFSANRGIDMFSRHLRAYLIDKFFVKAGKYKKNHVPQPYNYFEFWQDNMIYSGYTYAFTEGEEKFDSDYEGIPRRIDEWPVFQQETKKAGFDFSSRNCDGGGWAGGSLSFEDIIYFGDRKDGQFTNEWIVIDFCSKHVKFKEYDFNKFIKDNEKDIRQKLGDESYRLLIDPSLPVTTIN